MIIRVIRAMKYATVNPVNNQLLKEFPLDSFPDLNLSSEAFKVWRQLTVEERGTQLRKVAVLLEKNKKHYAQLITLEMGKPLRGRIRAEQSAHRFRLLHSQCTGAVEERRSKEQRL